MKDNKIQKRPHRAAVSRGLLHNPTVLCRGLSYYVRIHVPKSLQKILGCKELKRSLGSISLDEARLKSVLFHIRIKRYFDMCSKLLVSNPGLNEKLAELFKAELQKINVNKIPIDDNYRFYALEQRDMAEDAIISYQEMISDRSFHSSINELAKDIVSEIAPEVSGVSGIEHEAVCEGVARVLIEKEKAFIFRLTKSRLDPYVPDDPLFKTAMEIENCNYLQMSHNAQTYKIAAKDDSPTIAYLADKFLKSFGSSVTKKTLASYSAKIELAVRFLGEDTRVGQIKKVNIADFAEKLPKLTRNIIKKEGWKFEDLLTDDFHEQINFKTVDSIFQRIKAFFKWLRDLDYTETDLSEGVKIKAPKVNKSVIVRRPFSNSELLTIFSSPLYRGSKSISKRFESGDLLFRDETYWLPLLGYYTGARLGELVQLYFEDFRFKGDIAYIDINELDDGTVANKKHVKNKASVRLIPIHPDLLKLGFADFVKSQKLKGKGQRRIFWGIKYGADGKASTIFSKRFARFLDAINLKDRQLVFHSFRHNMEDNFRDASVPKYAIDSMIGHEDPTTAGKYGKGLSIEARYENLMKVKFPIDILGLLD